MASYDRLDKDKIINTKVLSTWDGYYPKKLHYFLSGMSNRSPAVQDAFDCKSKGTVILLKKDYGLLNVYSALKSKDSYEWVNVGCLLDESSEREFEGLPENIILEGVKTGPGSFSLNGKVRRYKA